MQSNNEERANLICNKIKVLRKKLLDLTGRNPLLSARLKSLIRIVDEVPELMLKSIADGDMKIVPLPALHSEPKDEKGEKFQSALIEARLNEQTYSEQLNKIDQTTDEAPNLLAKAERQLKDRLRKQLNMSPRQTKNDLFLDQHAKFLDQHAKNHDISPDYELPAKEEPHEDGRHTDKNIQTLLLPDMLEKRLNALVGKERTCKEERGISTLHAVFGFLEWEDGGGNSGAKSQKQYSPLVLLPVQITKKRDWGGGEFWVSGSDSEPQENKVLAEKLLVDHSITLSKYVGGHGDEDNEPNASGLEKYFKQIDEQKPRNMSSWRVRRWAAIGVFPSARLAMYRDLDPDGWDFASHDVISTLFGGSSAKGHDAPPCGNECDVDEPEIEKKVPCLIADADPSQFRTMVDVANGRNLAVEGPPGTGKSQTIVNTIAASLAAGKKVLFVAEKAAALNVVKAKLAAYKIGDFLLPLQAGSAGKKQVISSIKNRMNMLVHGDPVELNYERDRFTEARTELKSYIDILSSKYGETGLTVYEILGRRIKFSTLINGLPESIKEIHIPEASGITQGELKSILSKCEEVEKAWVGTLKHHDYWSAIKLPYINPSKADELLKLALKSSKLFFEASKARQSLEKFKLSPTIKAEKLKGIETIIKSSSKPLSDECIYIAARINSAADIESVKKHLDALGRWKEKKELIFRHLNTDDIDSVAAKNFTDIKELLCEYDLASLKEEDLDSLVAECKKSLEGDEQVKEICDKASGLSAALESLVISELVKVLEMVAALSKEALAVRKKELEEPSLKTIFENIRSLQDKKDILGEEFELSSLPTEPETITDYASVLAGAGWWDWIAFLLSEDYRRARGFYKSIALNGKFEKSTAADKLRKLSKWRLDSNKFCENEAIKNILGTHFNGVDTDFAPFRDAFSFFQRVDENFSGTDYAELRKFLKYGDGENLKSLPPIDSEHYIHRIKNLRLAELNAHLADSKNRLKKCETDVNSLKTLKKIFNDSEQMSKEQLIEFSAEFERLLAARKTLRDNRPIKNILGDSFKIETFDEAEAEMSLRLATHLLGLDEDSRKAFLYVAKYDAPALSSLEKIAAGTKTTTEEWLGDKSYADLSKQLESAAKDRKGLLAYSRFVGIKNELLQGNYKSLVDAIISAKRNELCDIVNALITDKIADEAYETYAGKLTRYNGEKLDSLRKKFQEADHKMTELNRLWLQYKLHKEANPPEGQRHGKVGELTEMALLWRETGKTKRHASVRSITKRATKALLELKPCWMMSPLAVAEYLPRGEVEFDLLIIDEASQMTPENAIGALVRCKQAMIVGDRHQLPPTNFFKKIFDDSYDDDDEDDEGEKVTEESILETANNHFRPKRQLRWHYRSKHSGLISFSNKYVYEDNLVVFPSPEELPSKIGQNAVKYEKVDGAYSKRTNLKEAEFMLKAIINFMRIDKDKSLGVVLLNQEQRDHLYNLWLHARGQYPHAKEYVEKWNEEDNGLQRFFIKNLENVQGDERDVIFIGTVYGPEKEGELVAQRFGPINRMEGYRRLNVLFSRAKERIVTFSSMTSADIRAEEGDHNKGKYMLKRWLEYSKTGKLLGGEYTKKEPDSDFEEHVIEQIESIGCEAIPQVGEKGYFIDIGVNHPDWPHGYIMGVECDGASYHSSPSARERDRLRQEVLEGLGWKLYRIWSTDWFADPQGETEKLREAITARVNELKNKETRTT